LLITLGLLPQLLKSRRVGCGVPDSVLNVPVVEIILNEPGVRALVGKSEAAGMPQHLRMREKGQGGSLAVFAYGEIDGRGARACAAR